MEYKDDEHPNLNGVQQWQTPICEHAQKLIIWVLWSHHALWAQGHCVDLSMQVHPVSWWDVTDRDIDRYVILWLCSILWILSIWFAHVNPIHAFFSFHHRYCLTLMEDFFQGQVDSFCQTSPSALQCAWLRQGGCASYASLVEGETLLLTQIVRHYYYTERKYLSRDPVQQNLIPDYLFCSDRHSCLVDDADSLEMLTYILGL